MPPSSEAVLQSRVNTVEYFGTKRWLVSVEADKKHHNLPYVKKLYAWKHCPGSKPHNKLQMIIHTGITSSVQTQRCQEKKTNKKTKLSKQNHNGKV